MNRFNRRVALRIAETLVSGLSDIPEIYDAAGAALERDLSGHGRPAFAQAAYDSFLHEVGKIGIPDAVPL